MGRGRADAEAEPAEEGEEQGDHHDAGEAPLLPDRAREEIRIRIREIAHLELAVSEPEPERATRAESEQRLTELEAPLPARLEEAAEPLEPVRLRPDQGDAGEEPRHAEQEEVPDPGAGGEEDHAADERPPRRPGGIGL